MHSARPEGQLFTDQSDTLALFVGRLAARSEPTFARCHCRGNHHSRYRDLDGFHEVKVGELGGE